MLIPPGYHDVVRLGLEGLLVLLVVQQHPVGRGRIHYPPGREDEILANSVLVTPVLVVRASELPLAFPAA